MPIFARALALAFLADSDCAAFLAASDMDSSAAATASGSSRAARTNPSFFMGSLLAFEFAHGAAGSAEQQQVRRAPREQADADHAGELVEVGLERDRVGDVQVAHVEDDVAVVGGEVFPQHGLAAAAHDLARDVAARHRDD